MDCSLAWFESDISSGVSENCPPSIGRLVQTFRELSDLKEKEFKKKFF